MNKYAEGIVYIILMLFAVIEFVIFVNYFADCLDPWNQTAVVDRQLSSVKCSP